MYSHAVHAFAALPARGAVPAFLPRRRSRASEHESARPGRPGAGDAQCRRRRWRGDATPSRVCRVPVVVAAVHPQSARLLHCAHHRLFVQPRALHFCNVF